MANSEREKSRTKKTAARTINFLYAAVGKPVEAVEHDDCADQFRREGRGST